MRGTWPAHGIFLHLITLTIYGKLYSYEAPQCANFLHPHVASSFSSLSILPSTLFSNILNLCSSLYGERSYRQEVKLYDILKIILICNFFEGDMKTERSDKNKR